MKESCKGNKENNKENPKGAFKIVFKKVGLYIKSCEKNVHYLLIPISI